MSTYQDQLGRELRAAHGRRRSTLRRVPVRAVTAAVLCLLVLSVAAALTRDSSVDRELPADGVRPSITRLSAPATARDQALQRRVRRKQGFFDLSHMATHVPIANLRVLVERDQTTVFAGRGRNDLVCSFVVTPEHGGFGCRKPWPTGRGEEDSEIFYERTFVAGLLYDGIDQVEAVYRDGHVDDVPVTANVFVIPRVASPRPDLVAVRWTDPGGARVQERFADYPIP